MSKLKLANEVKPEFKIIMNKAQTEAQMIIYGSIGDSWWDDAAVSADKFGKELDQLPNSITTINLRLNSPGGSVFDGIAIFNRLKQHKAKVNIYIDGIAASIASIIAMAGDNIYMGEGTQMMIHKPLTMTWGNRDEHDKSINVLDGIENQMIGIYSRKTGLERSEIKNMLDTGDYWMGSETAVSKGFATELMGEADQIKAAASMVAKAKWINLRSAPDFQAALEKNEKKEKANELKNKIEGSITRLKNAGLPIA